MDGEGEGEDTQLKLQRESHELIKEFEQSLSRFLWKPAGMFCPIDIWQSLPMHPDTSTLHDGRVAEADASNRRRV